MATMKQMLADLSARSDELKVILRALASNKTVDGKDITANTASTQRHHRTYESRIVALLTEIVSQAKVESFKLSANALTGFNQLVAPQQTVKIDVNEGDIILEVVAKYDGVKDVFNRITKAAEAKGLRLDMVSGKVIR